MEERSSHLIVVVGASAEAETLRRHLLRRGRLHAGVTSRTRGLRKMMVRGDFDRAVICLSVDQHSMRRYQRQFQSIVADRAGFTTRVGFVGLMGNCPLHANAATTGCDVYVHNASEALRAIRAMSRREIRDSSSWKLINRCGGEAVSPEVLAAVGGRTSSANCTSVVQHQPW